MFPEALQHRGADINKKESEAQEGMGQAEEEESMSGVGSGGSWVPVCTSAHLRLPNAAAAGLRGRLGHAIEGGSWGYGVGLGLDVV